MSWKKHTKKTYYYRNRRVGQRVVSEYLGSSDRAKEAAEQDNLRAQTKAKERQEFETAKQQFKQLETALDTIDALLQPLIHAHMLSAGYYLHKGQWRKKRAKIP